MLAQLNGRRDGTAAGVGLWLMVSLELSRSSKVSVCSWQQIRKRVWGRSYNTCVTVTRHNDRFVPVFGFMSASTIQIFKIILHRFVLMYCSLKLLAELE